MGNVIQQVGMKKGVWMYSSRSKFKCTGCSLFKCASGLLNKTSFLLDK